MCVTDRYDMTLAVKPQDNQPNTTNKSEGLQLSNKAKAINQINLHNLFPNKPLFYVSAVQDS